MKKIISLLLALALISSLGTVWATGSDIELYDYYATETLPQIYIETENGIALDDRSLIDPDEHTGMNGQLTVYNYVNAVISVRDCEGYELEDVTGQVKIRGNYTSANPKHPIRIKFDEKQPMCGLNDGNAIKNWVLLAEYGDSSLLHNSTMLYIANSLYSTTGNYASDFRNVEVYINGEYYGLYVLVEQQQVNEYRIDIPQPEDPADHDTASMTEEELAALKDGHTGYFIEYDGYYTNEDPSITFSIRYDEVTRPNGQTFLPTSAGNDPRESSGEASDEASSGWSGGWGDWGRSSNAIGDTRETGFTIKSDIYYEEQNAFIKNTIQTVWDVLYDAVYGDHSDLEANPYHTMDADGNYIEAPDITTAYEAVASVVDIDSLIDMYIIQEVGEDFDLDWSSRFFYIDMSPEGDHKLVYTAPWDFDGAFSNNTGSLYVMNYDNPWFVLFYYQDWFWQLVNERWDEAMEAGVFTGVLEMLDTVTEVNADAYDRNSERWSQSGGWGAWGGDWGNDDGWGDSWGGDWGDDEGWGDSWGGDWSDDDGWGDSRGDSSGDDDGWGDSWGDSSGEDEGWGDSWGGSSASDEAGVSDASDETGDRTASDEVSDSDASDEVSNSDASDEAGDRTASDEVNDSGASDETSDSDASGEMNESANDHVQAEQSLRSWLEQRISNLDRLFNEMVGESSDEPT